LDGLQKLEYRGYDSAGVGLVGNGEVKIYKDKGRVAHLKELVDTSFETHVGIGHTRWATHGSPTKNNAHPHTSQSGRFTIVHNGVIDNFRELKAKYLSSYSFKSQTDTEIIANLLERYYNKYGDLDRAISKTLSRLEGSFALLILDNTDLDTIYFAKNKTPLVVGIADDGVVFGSDVIPLVGNAEEYVSLDDGIKGKATKDGIVTYTDFLGTVHNIDITIEASGSNGLGQRFTSVAELEGKAFAIVNEEESKALYGSDNQNLAYDVYEKAFLDTNSGYLFKLNSLSSNADTSIRKYYLLRLIEPNGSEYSIWGSPGYLNSQPVSQWCSFILGLNNQNGQDMKNGAVWDIQYVDGYGFTLKNIGTGKYLHDAAPAKYDTPTYFTFCTIGGTSGVKTINSDNHDETIYNLQGIKIGTRNDINQLPRGLYLMNGKKFIVK
jgi:hypothetical protein